jgi:hypothetical protein
MERFGINGLQITMYDCRWRVWEFRLRLHGMGRLGIHGLQMYGWRWRV